MVRQWQDMFYDKRLTSVALVNPDFVMIAKAFGIPAQLITERKDLKDTLEKMLAAEGPYLLEIKVEMQGNVFPMIEPGSSTSDIRLTY
jgi:acetolactate synthase-1/2/3 large subunit